MWEKWYRQIALALAVLFHKRVGPQDWPPGVKALALDGLIRTELDITNQDLDNLARIEYKGRKLQTYDEALSTLLLLRQKIRG